MEYKVGFYYNLTHLSYHNNRLILVFNDGHLQFRLINPNLLQKYLLFCINMTSSYSFDYPILYKEYPNGDIQEVIFLKDLPEYAPKSENAGFSLGNPGKEVCTTSLFFDNNDLFQTNSTTDTKEQLFFKAVVHFYAVQKKVKYLRSEATPLTLLDSYTNYINKIKSYIDAIDIYDILSDLQVTVDDHLKTKIGDDDTYYIYRTAFVSSKKAQKDDYLKRVIGIGCSCIYEDRGYTNKLEHYAKDFIKKHPLGVYSGDLLEREKQQIIEKYSKEEHMGYLMAKRFIEKEKNRGYELPRWECILKDAYDYLYNKFHLINISNKDRNFEKRMYVLTNTNSDAQKEVDAINDYIRDITTYTP